LRKLVLGLVAFAALTAQANAAPFTISAIGTVVATDGTMDVPLGYEIAGNWVVDTVFANGTDDNAGIPSPTYDVQITFALSSYAEVRDGGGTPVPGQNVTTPITSLFYHDDEVILAAALVGSVAEGLVADGTYDSFEVNAAETWGVQDPNTGEYAPHAPPGSGDALEVLLIVLGDSTWFTGGPSQLLDMQAGAFSVILITQFNEQGDEIGHLAATVDTISPTAPSAVPVPKSLLFLGSAIMLAGVGAKLKHRRNR
jgi:hypothetical protein